MRTPHLTSPHPPIAELALLLDDALGAEAGHAAAHLSRTEDDEIEIGVLPIPAALHPFSVLAGTCAPAEWELFGVRARGRARALDGDGAEGRPAAECTTTYLVGRSGEEVAVLREGGRTSVIHQPAEGTIPDLCRLVLGLPTPPPPAPSHELFTLAWLDRVHEIATAHPAVCLSAATVAALHPAGTKVTDGARFAGLTEAHAAAWPWSRLRAEPHHLALPGGDLEVEVTSWMDDGAYARWALGAYPRLEQLRSDVLEVLVGGALDLVARATG